MIVYATRGEDRVPVLVDDDYEVPGALSIASHGYAQVCPPGTGGRSVLLHRHILGLTTGDGMVGDHINRDILDNRRANLRAVDPSTSNRNRCTADGATVGVYPARSGRWIARLKWRRVQHYIGTFDTPDEAAAAVAAFRLAECADSLVGA